MTSSATRVALLGGRGFVGSAVARAARASGHETVDIGRIDLRGSATDFDAWIADHGDDFGSLIGALAGTRVVINAAGLAAPHMGDEPALTKSNALLPVILGRAAKHAGVRRFVHISSAAVQGNRRTLDETAAYAPFSPYSASKVDGEERLHNQASSLPEDLIIYRPTSVQGVGRPITHAIGRIYSGRAAICLGSTKPLPMALVDHVGEVALRLSLAGSSSQIVLHPWEGITQRGLADAFSAPTTTMLTIPIPRSLRGPVGWLSRRTPIAAGKVRQLELLAFGQSQQSSISLDDPQDLLDRWIELGRLVRSTPA